MKNGILQKNGAIDEHKLSHGRISLWWIGKECGHSWRADAFNRRHGTSCPYCSSNKVLSGYNDFETHYPEWATFWDAERNGGLLPSQVMKKSPTKRWWLCVKGHSYQQAPKVVASLGPRCPKCLKVFSPLEEIVAIFLRDFYKGEIQERRRIIEHSPGARGRWEIDILLPELKIGFEIQDFATHSRDSDSEVMAYKGLSGFKAGPSKHALKKDLAMAQHGIAIVELWEDEIISGAFRDVVREALVGLGK